MNTLIFLLAVLFKAVIGAFFNNVMSCLSVLCSSAIVIGRSISTLVLLLIVGSPIYFMHYYSKIEHQVRSLVPSKRSLPVRDECAVSGRKSSFQTHPLLGTSAASASPAYAEVHEP